MLPNLLPGLRDLRAPLAAGYLWLAAGWLYLAPQLPASVNEAQGILEDIYRVVNASGPITVAAGLAFVAYLLGILSTGLLIRPIRFIVKLPVYILAVPLVIPALISIMLLERSTSMESKLNDFFAAIQNVKWRLHAPSLPSIRADQLALRRMSNRVLMDEDYRGILLTQLRDRLGAILSNSSLTLGRDGLRRLQFVRDLMDDESMDDNAKEAEILERISKYLDEGYLEAAEALVLSVVNVNHHGRDILDELTLVPERLVGDRPATYERWDRLRAEGEFRQAVVPPLLAMIGVLLVRGVLGWPLVLLSIVPPLLILIQGMSKEKQADSQLLQVLEANVISTVAIDRLMTRDLYWFRGRSHWGVSFPEEEYSPGDD
jgi:hypothetical protein